MKVALIYAKAQNLKEQAASLYADETATKGEMSRDEVYPPLGISTLAAWLEQIGGYEVRLHDDSIEPIESLREAMEWADVVGISALTPNARRAKELGIISRQEIGKPTIIGGPHPTTNPEYFLEPGAADVCVRGEGDYTLPELLEAIDEPEKWEGIKGLAFLKDGEVLWTEKRPLLKDLDEVPFPAYHLWDIPQYMRLSIHPAVTLITSRGCPYACTFCDAEMTPRKYRALSPQRTVDLIEYLLKVYDPPQLCFFDDLFTIQRKRVIALCQEIIRRDLFIEWSCESRVDTMDYEMLRWLRKAGCIKIYYGLESGSSNMLTTMKKGVTPERVKRGAKLNRELGMYFKFFLLYGFPEETGEDHYDTERLIDETRPDAVCCSILQPIPGTEVYEQLKDQLFVDVTETDFHYWHAGESFKHPIFTHQEIRDARERVLQVCERNNRNRLARLRRKLERVWAMARHPELIGDMLEVGRRKKRYLSRVKDSDWAYAIQGPADRQKLQVPQIQLD